MPNIDEVFAGKTMKAADIGDDEPIYVITEIEARQFKGKDGSPQKKLVFTFAGEEQQFVCNKTNAKIIAKQYGPNTESWIGKKVQLYVTDVDFGGDIVPGIRVRVQKAKPAPVEHENPGAGLDDEIPF